MDEVEEMIEAARRDGATRLDLGGRGLTALPASLGSLTGLTELFVYGNRLLELPAAVRALTGLSRLAVSGNALTTLPEWLGELGGLTWLNADRNRLVTLPAALGELSGLTDLHLAGNRLTALPGTIGRLAALTRLDLSGNRFTELPDELGDLPALVRLDLAGNPLVVVPGWLNDAAGEPAAPVVVHAATDDGGAVATAAGLDALFDRRPGGGVTLTSAGGERELYLSLDGEKSWLAWQDDRDVLLSWGPVPPGAPPGQVCGDYVDALSDPWFGSTGDDDPPGIGEALARRAGHEFLRTGRRPRCVQWVVKP